jgi:type 1 fimbria pilin
VRPITSVVKVRWAIVATVAAALALPAASAAAPGGVTVYRGTSHGVTCVLRRTAGGATLTITFGTGSDAAFRRAAATELPEEFLVWPPPTGSPPGVPQSFFAESVKVDAKRRQAQLRLSKVPQSTGFLCGLHLNVPAKGNLTAARYLSNPLVLVRLAPTRG